MQLYPWGGGQCSGNELWSYMSSSSVAQSQYMTLWIWAEREIKEVGFFLKVWKICAWTVLICWKWTILWLSLHKPQTLNMNGTLFQPKYTKYYSNDASDTEILLKGDTFVNKQHLYFIPYYREIKILLWLWKVGVADLYRSMIVDTRPTNMRKMPLFGNLIWDFKILQVNIKKGSLNTRKLSKGSWRNNLGWCLNYVVGYAP